MSIPELKIKTDCFPGVELIEPDFYEDFRGEYWTVYNEKKYKKEKNFFHTKATKSRMKTLRGIHGDFETTKLISCLSGEVYCVIVDNRKNSKNYLEWRWIMLTCNNKKSIIVPPGVGLSYLVMSESASVLYQLSYSVDYQDVNNQFTISWNDKDLKINWPFKDPILQNRDLKNEKEQK